MRCECFHDAHEHSPSRSRCQGTDSYGIACGCPSFVELDLDNDEPDEPAQIQRRGDHDQHGRDLADYYRPGGSWEEEYPGHVELGVTASR